MIMRRSWARFGNSGKGSDETLAVRRGLWHDSSGSIELSGVDLHRKVPVLAIKRLAWSYSGMPLVSISKVREMLN